MAFLGAMYMYAYVFMQIPTGILEPRRTITLGMAMCLYEDEWYNFPIRVNRGNQREMSH